MSASKALIQDGSLGRGIYIDSYKDPNDEKTLHLCLRRPNATTPSLASHENIEDDFRDVPKGHEPLYTIVTDGKVTKKNITHIGFLNTYKLYRSRRENRTNDETHLANRPEDGLENQPLRNQTCMEDKPFAIIHPLKVYFADFDTEILTKYPKGKFVYCKRWWGLKRYYRVEGKEYRIGDEGFKTIASASLDRK